MRVLHVSKTSKGAFWAARQVSQLVRAGVEVHVALPQRLGAAVPAWSRSGAVLHWLDCSVPVRKPTTMPQATRAVRSLVNDIKPDIIHSHFVSTSLMLRIALGRNHPTPRIFQVPGPLHLEHWHTRAIELSSAGRNDFWIASSQFVQRAYQAAGIPRRKLFLSYYSVDVDTSSCRRTGYLRQHLNIPQDAFIVGNINLIYPPKRYLGHKVGLKCHEDVIEAISLVQKQHADVWGVLIGGTFGDSDAYEKGLRTLAEKKGRGQILMPGKFDSDDVTRSWPDYDCAVHVPLSENCGGVVEPMLSSVPTIAGQVGGLPEVVHGGLTGDIVPIRCPEALARGIVKVRERYAEYKHMAGVGRELVSSMFEPQRCAREILQIYRHVLYGEPRPDEFSPERFLETKVQKQTAMAAGAH